jgi:hypothetical protein
MVERQLDEIDDERAIVEDERPPGVGNGFHLWTPKQ